MFAESARLAVTAIVGKIMGPRSALHIPVCQPVMLRSSPTFRNAYFFAGTSKSWVDCFFGKSTFVE